MTDTSVDTLVKYGTSFQTKCVVGLLTDREFMDQTVEIVDPKYFEGEANRWIVDRILWYYNEYRSLVTLDVIKRESDKLPESSSVLKAAIIESMKDVFFKIKATPEDLDYIKKEFLEFCKNQSIKKAILESADLLQGGKYDQIKVLIDKAMHAGQERNIGHIWTEDLETRVSKVTRNVVPTRWDCINEITDGGLGAGELGCIIAPSGIGKSWFMADLGAFAAEVGKKTAHYTFELSESYVGLRYDTIFTGIEPNKIKDNTGKVRTTISEVPGQVFIKYFPTRSATVNTLRAHLERLYNLGNGPDLILIDYADLMMSAAKADNRTEMLGLIHEEIRGLAGEYKVPIWTASQSQRSALQDDIVEADKIAGAYAKIMTDDFVFSVSRKAADKITNTARAHIIKNRFGPDGMTFPALTDLEHGKLRIYDEASPEGIKLKAIMQSGEGQMKQLMNKKLIDLQKSKNGISS
ncbi:MAG: AAA family ATPase [Bacteroidetes bacterium]|nr:AAA family ATPase [Bacteroidota bacterium]